LLKKISVIERDFFIIIQPFAVSLSVEELKLVELVKLAGIQPTSSLVALAAATGLLSGLIAVGPGAALIAAGLIGSNLQNKEKQQQETDFQEPEVALEKIKTIIEIYYRFEAYQLE
jgi:hypothetical protein